MEHYSTKIPEAANELFDGELVIAHYGSGLYYSVSPSGTLIWQGLDSGLSDDEVTIWLANYYVDQSNGVGPLVQEFIAKMLAESLLIAVNVPRPKVPLPELTGSSFSIPVLERFDDLQELLLIDPVHDVDTTGWPRRADDGAR